MQKLNKFMSHSRRLKLDSVAAGLDSVMGSSSQLDGSGGADLFNFQVHSTYFLMAVGHLLFLPSSPGGETGHDFWDH